MQATTQDITLFDLLSAEPIEFVKRVARATSDRQFADDLRAVELETLVVFAGAAALDAIALADQSGYVLGSSTRDRYLFALCIMARRHNRRAAVKQIVAQAAPEERERAEMATDAPFA